MKNTKEAKEVKECEGGEGVSYVLYFEDFNVNFSWKIFPVSFSVASLMFTMASPIVPISFPLSVS